MEENLNLSWQGEESLSGISTEISLENIERVKEEKNN